MIRIAFAAALMASTASAKEPALINDPCMAVIGPMAYGPENFESGVIAGIIGGYALANGYTLEDSERYSAQVGRVCRNTPGMTFLEALETLSRRSR